MIIATLLSLSVAQAEVTCTQNCESIAISEGVNYGISQIVGKKKEAPKESGAFTVHCMITGAKPTDRWPCDSVEVKSAQAPARIYRGDRLVLVPTTNEPPKGEVTVRRSKCPADERKVFVTEGGNAAIEFRETDCKPL